MERLFAFLLGRRQAQRTGSRDVPAPNGAVTPWPSDNEEHLGRMMSALSDDEEYLRSVIAALDALINAVVESGGEWAATRAVLERQANLLLGPTAEALLDLQIQFRRARATQQDLQEVADFEHYAQLLRTARREGIPRAWQEFSDWLRTADIIVAVSEWLALPNVHEHRRYLEAHPVLLDPSVDDHLQSLETGKRAETILALQWHDQAAFMLYATQLDQPGPSEIPPEFDPDSAPLQLFRVGMAQADDIHRRRQLLTDIRARGGELESIHAVYVNYYGGFALDLPDWLEADLQRVDEMQMQLQPPSMEVVNGQSEILDAAVVRALEDQDIAPEVRAELSLRLWEVTHTSAEAALELDEDEDGDQENEHALLEFALNTYTESQYPIQHARALICLGNTWEREVGGDRIANLLSAINAYQRALGVYALERFPVEHAMTQHNLGNAYGELGRLRGMVHDSLEQSKACYERALGVRTIVGYPVDWAATQNALAGTLFYLTGCEEVPRDVRELYTQQAVASYTSSLRVRTLERFPTDYAMTQLNLCNTCLHAMSGDRGVAVAQAEACLIEALKVYTYESHPQGFARTMVMGADMFYARPIGERNDNLKMACACLAAAVLLVWTPNRFPREHRDAQAQLAHIGCELENWGLVHEAAAAAIRAAKLLPETNTPSRDFIPITVYTFRDASTYNGTSIGALSALDAYSLVRLGRVSEGALAVEDGRARELAWERTTQMLDPDVIKDPTLRARFIKALKRLRAASALLKSSPLSEPTDKGEERRDGWIPPSLDAWVRAGAFDKANETNVNELLVDVFREILQHQSASDYIKHTALYLRVQTEFDAIAHEIRVAEGIPDFLVATPTEEQLFHAAERGGNGHALVYLVPTDAGGVALGVFTQNPQQGTQRRIRGLELPHLTKVAVRKLVEDIDEAELEGRQRVYGGFCWAQERKAQVPLLRDWPGSNLRERVEALRSACAATGRRSTLLEAAKMALDHFSREPKLAHLLDAPMKPDPDSLYFKYSNKVETSLSHRDASLLLSTLNQYFLRAELRCCLPALSDLALLEVAGWLEENKVASVTLVPCAELAIFPLHAVELAPGRTFGDAFACSVAPSAQALLRDEREQQQAQAVRKDVVAVGDPDTSLPRLEWAEAEARTIAKLAHEVGHHSEVQIGSGATRTWFLERLSSALVVDASCHGKFDAFSPLDSWLALAHDMPLTLRDLLVSGLSGVPSLTGLRLFILSACQTAILDRNSQLDEVRTLTAGFLQAGADATLGALWAVDDRATYLLMVKFAELWLPHMQTLPPAKALADAARWLRTVRNRELRQWHRYQHPRPDTTSRSQPESRDESQMVTSASSASMTPPPADSTAVSISPGVGVPALSTDDFSAPLLVARAAFSSTRMDAEEAIGAIQRSAGRGDDDAAPYSDPFFWAGFQVTGW